MLVKRTLYHFHFCCGLGGGAKGFNRARPRVGNVEAHWECIGGIDVDSGALRDFAKLAGVPGTQLDLFTRDQYIRFHGKEPPADWREATPEDIRRAAGGKRPDCVFISSPCKGASGLLSEERAKTPRYQALNELTLRCIWLMGEAWADDPVPLIAFENVPRLATRGRHLLDQIGQLLGHYGFANAETTHDCGELGGLAQSRKRFLLVARNVEKVPAFLYEPEKKSLRAVGDILGRMPLPGDIEAAGPMHRVPSLHWKTWVRLALVRAGSDWRSLNELAIEDGQLRDLVIVPEYRDGYMGVHGWDDTAGTIAGRSGPTNGAFSVADPRYRQAANWNHGQQFGVIRWAESSPTIPGQTMPGQGTFSVADPRPNWNRHSGNYRVIRYDQPAGTIIAGGKGVQGGQQSVADPRILHRSKGDNYLTGGHYGVIGFDQHSGAIAASSRYDSGRFSVADPRIPAADDRLTCIIRSLDGTWHRPFTTLEKAALQSLVDPEEYLVLDGMSDKDWSERIGNAVPPHAAEAIADVMGTTLLLAEHGETFMLNNTPIWVRNIAVALSVAQQEVDHG
ncbi:TPA: DNA cytosine methyltransferase [Pseudomonas aeruginosa]|uniref:DNA cytosine methyltransferase n=1 Tax=Pseudomonas nitroreducens TaxID=46680 RepID=UPI00244B76B8|nr:DNA cytosine methyltransferase [Pseudomonas nitroreducens]HCK4502992.1 DNA cytosine methyltransferase [Pseudomonas aeruginosa]MDG9854151.1 DNA cytosine methyltransferase [Pseudomonas nitroreducens]HCK4574085.1 DNA cytosine methyltransferase [Pseudomonas aeruginosa]HCK4790528.1 DNA cytosine methyltransferase [Pseudomonas aeruginosa]HCK4799660.1 DNA cytosine methyltransferase [Pseudomonas aeruginosa]